jgi:hypothetical protein
VVGWFWLGLTGSSWFGSWYAAGAKPVCMVLGYGYRGETCELYLVLAIGVRLVSSVRFWLQGETYELFSVLALGVRPVSWWPWVTVG